MLERLFALCKKSLSRTQALSEEKFIKKSVSANSKSTQAASRTRLEHSVEIRECFCALKTFKNVLRKPL